MALRGRAVCVSPIPLRGNPGAEVLSYPDRDSVQTAVARGAALHALALARSGRGLVQPVANDTILLRTEVRLVELIPKGAGLPFPAEGWARKDCLTVPVTSPKRPVELRVELIAGEGAGERPLFRGRWSVPGPVSKGEGMVLEYRYDANQVLELRLRLAAGAGTDAWACAVENPLTNVVNPQEARLKLDTLEEAIRTGAVPKDEVPGALVEAADLMAELGHRERAFAQLKKVLASRNAPDGGILNRMGMLAAEIGDAERAVKLYGEAAAAEPSWGGPLFNLALLLQRRGDPAGALEALDGALEREILPPYLVLRAGLASTLGREAEAARDLAAAVDAFGPPVRLSEWALGWLIKTAAIVGDTALQEKGRAELKLRRRGTGGEDVGGLLPSLRRRNVTLLEAFRCCPYIAELASQFVAEPEERAACLAQVRTTQTEREQPVVLVAPSAGVEMVMLADALRTRLARSERVGILVPKRRVMAEVAAAMREAGIAVEASERMDFASDLPKVMPYHSAKGITLDSVLLPGLQTENFQRYSPERIERLLFVAITRAQGWAYLSTVAGGKAVFAPLERLLTRPMGHNWAVQDWRKIPPVYEVAAPVAPLPDDDLPSLL